MSVILTAGKKFKPKSAKPKKKRACIPQPTPYNDPPVSTAKTAVWHWIMDSMTTTVIFTKENSEVWCNGVVLDTIDGFTEDDQCGGVIDFCIFIEETQVAHKARIVRLLPSSQRDMMTHQLYVDGYQLFDYHGQTELQELPPLETGHHHYNNGATVEQQESFDYPPEPPTYDEAVASGYQTK